MLVGALHRSAGGAHQAVSAGGDSFCAAVLLCGSICGAESWRDFVIFGQEKLDFLREYFPFSAGIPCKNTFSRVCAAVEPEQFGACFLAWAASLPRVSGEVIAIDGKTLCNSADAAAGAAAIHMVSAFATDSRLVLALAKKWPKNPMRSRRFQPCSICSMSAATPSRSMPWIASAALPRRSATRAPITSWRSRATKARATTMCACFYKQKRPSPCPWPSTTSGAKPTPGTGVWSHAGASLATIWTGWRKGPSGAACAASLLNRRDARHQRQSQLRAALFHQQFARQCPANCPGGARPLGDREHAALDARCRV